jgi:hypothetical protein
MRRNTRVVVSASRLLWNIETRFAGTRCTRPSVESELGLTVAALAAHIDDALLTEASNAGLSA